MVAKSRKWLIIASLTAAAFVGCGLSPGLDLPNNGAGGSLSVGTGGSTSTNGQEGGAGGMDQTQLSGGAGGAEPR